MPNINDIATIAEALEKSPVAVLADRCAAVRNRNVTCRACVDACIADAIEVLANEVHLSASSCVGCGACTAVCPTEALAFADPSDAALAEAAAKAAAANAGQAVFACRRISSKRLADPALYAEVPCLGRMEESLLVSLAAHGASSISLIDGNCATCKYGACSPSVDDAVAQANALLACQGSAVRVERASAFPEGMLIDAADAQGAFGSTRRAFFSEAASSARETAMTAARTTIDAELGYTQAPAPIGERLRVGADGSMPRLDMPRHDVLMNALDALGEPVGEVLRSRRFGMVDIDPAACNACGMCAVFCSTGALRRADGGGPSEPLSLLEFSPSECVRCGLCADVCWKGALSLSGEVPTARLFDFEPVAFDVAQAPSAKKGFFGR